jgi:predicted amidohydrolase YtcJ
MKHAVLVMAFFFPVSAIWAQQYPDIIIYGGNVLTASTARPADALVAEAVAVRGSLILAVGTNQEILKMAGPQTLKIDVEYKSVIPGRIDTQVQLNEIKSLGEKFQIQAEGFLAQGVTTVGAHLSNEALDTLRKLGSQGRLPIRVAYTADASAQKLATSEMLWNNPTAGSINHCSAIRKEDIARAKDLKLAVSCEPPLGIRLEDGTKLTDTEIQFGSQEGGDVRSPFRSLIDAGLHPALGTNSFNYYSFLATQQLVIRAFPNTRVLGPQQRISREEALYTSTRWAAEYVGKAKDLGSIEPGKLADIIILDRNYSQVRQDGLNEINVVVTMLSGKIVYTEPDYANRKGLPQLGYRGNLGSILIRGRLTDKLPYQFKSR